jgi:hypothetical protein
MKTSQYQREQEAKATIRGQIKRHSNEIVKEIKNEIILMAKKVATIFLGDVFRNIFSLEKSIEYSRPYVFQMGDDTDQILYDRLNSHQINNLPYYIINEEVLAKSYRPTREANFVVLIDLSMSMLYRWPLIKLATANKFLSLHQVDAIKEQCRQTKLYALKYLTYAFIDSAIQNDFKVRVVLFSNQIQQEIKENNDKRFPAFVLNHIDEHLIDSYAKAVSKDRYSEVGGYLTTLANTMHKRKRCFVLFLSDFLDGIEELKPYLIELQYKIPLIMGVINDPYEINFPSRKFMTPVTVTHEHCKNFEQDMEREVRLSNKHINEFNSMAEKRRKDIFEFFNKRKIKYLDISTQNNDKIPHILQKFNAQLLEET